jgi:hypothetical protein
MHNVATVNTYPTHRVATIHNVARVNTFPTHRVATIHNVERVNKFPTHRVAMMHNIKKVNAFATHRVTMMHNIIREVLTKQVNCGRFKKQIKHGNQYVNTASLRGTPSSLHLFVLLASKRAISISNATHLQKLSNIFQPTWYRNS